MDKLHEESRKQFEKYFDDFYGCHPTDHHDPMHVEGIWHAWQASRASIAVKLPEQKEDRARNLSSDDVAYGFNQGVGACRDVIRSIGLSIKWE